MLNCPSSLKQWMIPLHITAPFRNQKIILTSLSVSSLPFANHNLLLILCKCFSRVILSHGCMLYASMEALRHWFYSLNLVDLYELCNTWIISHASQIYLKPVECVQLNKFRQQKCVGTVCRGTHHSCSFILLVWICMWWYLVVHPSWKSYTGNKAQGFRDRKL